MKDKFVYKISEYANIVMVYVFILGISVFAFMMADFNINFMFAVAVFLLLVGTYIIRKKIKNMIFYFFCIIAQSALLLLLPIPKDNMGFFVMIEIVYLIINVWYYFTRLYYGLAYISIYCIVSFAVEFFIADVKGFDAQTELYFAFGIIYFFMHYIRLFMSNINMFSLEKNKNNNMPFWEMIKNDSKLTIPFICFSLIVMFSLKVDFLDTWLGKAYNYLIGYVRDGLTFLIDFLDYLFNLIFKSYDVVVKPPVFVADSAKEPSVAMNIVSTTVVIGLILLAIFIVCYSAYRFLKSVETKDFEAKTSIEENGMIEVHERIKSKKVKKEKLSSVRKQYKQTVERIARKGVSVYTNHTPDERAEYIKKESKENIDELTKKYKKERYSKQN